MIVSYKHKLIFLHTKKTAGSSISVSLSRYLGKDDLLIMDPNDFFEENIFPKPWFKNSISRFLLDKTSNLKSKMGGKIHERIGKKIFINQYKKYIDRSGYHLKKHSNAKKVQSVLDQKQWSKFYKVAFERNPWDKAVSLFHWNMYKMKEPISFSFWLDCLEKENWDELRNFTRQEYLNNNGFGWWKDPSGWDIYTIDGLIAPNFIGRYEFLHEDLEKICETVGISWDGWLPKSKVLSTQRDLSKYYGKNEDLMIRKLFKKEIEKLDYESPLPEF